MVRGETPRRAHRQRNRSKQEGRPGKPSRPSLMLASLRHEAQTLDNGTHAPGVADDSTYGEAGPEEQKRRDGLDLVVGGGGSCLLELDLDDFQGRGKLPFEL